MLSKFNGTPTPKGSYRAKTGDNDCNVNSSRYRLSTALCESIRYQTKSEQNVRQDLIPSVCHGEAALCTPKVGVRQVFIVISRPCRWDASDPAVEMLQYWSVRFGVVLHGRNLRKRSCKVLRLRKFSALRERNSIKVKRTDFLVIWAQLRLDWVSIEGIIGTLRGKSYSKTKQVVSGAP